MADITTRAGVSRSTFYAHYSGMDALLAESIAGPFAVLADTINPDFAAPKLIALLEHFWENRALASSVDGNPARTGHFPSRLESGTEAPAGWRGSHERLSLRF